MGSKCPEHIWNDFSSGAPRYPREAKISVQECFYCDAIRIVCEAHEVPWDECHGVECVERYKLYGIVGDILNS